MVDKNPVSAALVIGGGVAGQRAALDIAEAGFEAILVERGPSLGGVVAQLGYMFPTHDCVLCRGGRNHGNGCTRPAISPAFHENSRHPNLQVWASTEVVRVEGEAPHFRAVLRQRPQYVDPALCINCDACAEVCPIEIPNAYHEGLGTRKLVDKGLSRAIPDSYNLWEKVEYCETCRKCEPACPTKAINLQAQSREWSVDVSAIVLTSGYKLFDPKEYGEYGHGRYPNVLTSLEFERLISRNGPVLGHLETPGIGGKPARIAWLQCVGSRDEKHPWCSAICCMHATKEAIMTKERVGDDVDCRIFLMDQRTFNKDYHLYYERSREQYGIQYIRSRISGLRQDPRTKKVILRYQDEAGAFQNEPFDIVVLSVGVQPPAQSEEVAGMLGIDLSETGFCNTGKYTPVSTNRPGVFAAGAVVAPLEMAESFSAASAAASEVVRTLAAHAKPRVPARLQLTAAEGPARVGFFACACGQAVAGRIDTVDLAGYGGALKDVAYSSTIDFACLPQGQEIIKNAMAAHGLNRLVVAGCSERTHLPLFESVAGEAGVPAGLVGVANIREQCAWVHTNPVQANRKAREICRMAVARVAKAAPLSLETISPMPSALILGGGIAGMNAALAMADAGLDVTLAEKTDRLGGFFIRKRLLAEGDDPAEYLESLVRQVESHEHIKVLTGAVLRSQSGRPGRFRSVLEQANGGEPQRLELEHGATVLAIGGLPYAGSEYMLGQHPAAVSQLELENLLVEDPQRASTLKEVVMIQCAGRDETPGSPCSRICCTGAIANALKLKELNPSCRVYILYRDVMTYGPREQYYTQAREKGVIFVRYEPAEKPQVALENDSLSVRILERTLQETLQLRPDLLVLSTVTRPAPDLADVAGRLGLALSPDGFFGEAHTKMRPTEFVRPGIFVAGLAHYPKFAEDSIAQAKAVANQTMQLVGHGEIQVGGRLAEVTQEKCMGCLTCVRICPYTAPHIDPQAVGAGAIQGASYIDPARCQGCGKCVAECPNRAISMAGFADEALLAPDSSLLGRWQVA